MIVNVNITGRGYVAAAGVRSVDLEAGANVSAAISAVRTRLGEGTLSAATLVFVNGRHLGTLSGHRDELLADGDTLLLLQPVAGG